MCAPEALLLSDSTAPLVAKEVALEELAQAKAKLEEIRQKNIKTINAIKDYNEAYKKSPLEPTAIRRKRYYFAENYPNPQKLPANDQVPPFHSIMKKSFDGEIVISNRRVFAILDGEKIVKFRGTEPVLIDAIVDGRIFTDSNDPQLVDQLVIEP